MTKVILSIYDYFKKHPVQAWISFLIVTGVLIMSLLSLHYKEDISDFLPLDESNHTALAVYQDISGANNIIATIATKDSINVDPQELVDGVESFVSAIESADSLGYVKSLIKEIDVDLILEVADNVYQGIPYYLTDKDYARIDSLLAIPTYLEQQLEEDKQMLQFPASSLFTRNISKDPLNLFTPVLSRIKQGSVDIEYETYDSYILSPDEKRAVVVIESSFGANESENNSLLVGLLNNAKHQTEIENANLDIHIIGGPAIAVTNASQIKNDSVLAICIAGVLILALLIYVFKSTRNILLIVVSVGWGWLFAMGGIALFYDSISIIVIGIASVILGIAINYPLHLIDHLQHSVHPKEALKEIISPLVVGNVTTVGAFLCLMPLNSVALHDLGLFSSLLLSGTILFVLIFLPHVLKIRKVKKQVEGYSSLITKLASISIEKNKWVIWSVFILTVFFGYFSLRTEFDSDMRNINFMTPQQKSDLEYFSHLTAMDDNSENIYVVSNGNNWNEALTQNQLIDKTIDALVSEKLVTRKKEASPFLHSESQQHELLSKWDKFVARHKEKLISEVTRKGTALGFNEEAFSTFYDILNAKYEVQPFEYFEPLTSSVFKGNISENSIANRKSIVQVLEVKPENVEIVKTRIKGSEKFNGLAFDVKSMNSSITNTLSNDFNYIGIACGFIVFVFLWISLGSIELAMVSFLPMAVSWIWILGIMGLLGIKFNIVNIILATFIFGQGDDYTIFMTEGLSYEFAYRKKLLSSYKSSIIVSALIMFIGIGTLIFAKHPAMRSLEEVTVVGMLSVVLMAYFFPPLIFNWLVRKKGKVRYRPITLKKILCTGFCACVFLFQLMAAYIMGFFMFVMTKPTPRKKLILHRFCCSVFRWDVKRMPGIKFRYENPNNENFSKPVIVISNHQSLLDSFYLMTLTPKIILVANDHVNHNPITGRMFRWLDFITIGQGAEGMIDMLRPLVEQGYSIGIFPEGERPTNISNRVKRFHKGAFEFSSELGLDIVPVYLHGILQVMPKGSALSNGGEILIKVGEKITRQDLLAISPSIKEQTQAIRHAFQKKFIEICENQDTVANLAPIVYDKYKYKGTEIERNAKKSLKAFTRQNTFIQGILDEKPFIVIDECGQGELSLLLALMYSNREIYSVIRNTEGKRLLSCILPNFACNVNVVKEDELPDYGIDESHIFIVTKNEVFPKAVNPNYCHIIV